MKITLIDKSVAWMALLSGLSISVVAIYYSVAGLVAIFAAAAVPIMVMGVTLEVSKLIASLWLKWNWHRAPAFIKAYLLVAILTLMLITSMGIFGFLSKAHIDQATPAGDAIAQVQIIDEKISIQQDIITQYKKDLTVLNNQIDRYNELGAVTKGVTVRKQQQAERTEILSKIDASQQAINNLREEKFPLASQARAIEAEVGPIKYIAAVIYGDNTDVELLERAVRWIIIIIVLVFDPLAIVMLLASQYSFQWFKTEEFKNTAETAALEPSTPLPEKLHKEPSFSSNMEIPEVEKKYSDEAEEALKWADEQEEKKRTVDWIERENGLQIKKSQIK
jgi:hypothetical protein